MAAEPVRHDEGTYLADTDKRRLYEVIEYDGYGRCVLRNVVTEHTVTLNHVGHLKLVEPDPNFLDPDWHCPDFTPDFGTL